jgi:hypothetical protein
MVFMAETGSKVENKGRMIRERGRQEYADAFGLTLEQMDNKID